MNQPVETQTHDREKIGKANDKARILQLEAPTNELPRLLNSHQHASERYEADDNAHRIDQTSATVLLRAAVGKAQGF